MLLPGQSAGAAELLVREFPPGLIVPPGAEMSADFNVDEATQAYMDLLTPAQRARSDAYFEGGYWLQLWGFLYSLGVAWVILGGRRSARVRDSIERITRRRWLQVFIYSALYVLAAFLLTLPWTIYTDFLREHAYGLANQTFVPWFGEQLTGLVVTMLTGALFMAAAYAFVRKFANSWWIWLSGFTVVFLLVFTMIAPVWVLPLFNDYKILAEGPVKSAVLGMARANGVPAENVYWFDASKQSNRVSANVSGFLGTTSGEPERQPAEQDIAPRDQGGNGTRIGPLRAASPPSRRRLFRHRLRGRLCLRPVERTRADPAMARAIWFARPGRRGRTAPGVGVILDLPVRRDAGNELDFAAAGRGSRLFRFECGA